MNQFARSKGAHGESVAVEYLVREGYRILARNFLSRWGEIDVLAESRSGVLVAVEVKHYAPSAMVDPLSAVTPSKIKKIEKTLAYYMTCFPNYWESDRAIHVIVVGNGRVREHLTTLN